MEETVQLTREKIEAGRTGKGGYRKKQLKVLGVEYPPKQGWIDGLIGKTVSLETYQRYLNLSTKIQAKKIVAGNTEQQFTKRAKKLAAPELADKALDLELLSKLSNDH